MRIQNKTFYADLFSKSSGPVPAPGVDTKTPPAASKLTAIKPMAPLAPALSSKTPDALPEKLPVQAALPVPVEAPAAKATSPVPAPAPQKRSALMELIGDADIHDMSPRQMTHLSQTLYAAGALSFEDYSQLAFQPELHPDYDRTIGALTGEHAAPDRRRDFVNLWNERADFQRRHNVGRPDLIAQSERIASVLNRIEAPMNMVA